MLGLWVSGRGGEGLGPLPRGPALASCAGERGGPGSLPHLTSRSYGKGKNNFVSLWDPQI